MKKDLQKITGQESGIVCFGNEVIVCNWANQCPAGRPILSPFGEMMSWPVDDIKVISKKHYDDIRDALPGEIVSLGKDDGVEILEADSMEILSDYNGDICALWGWDLSGNADITRDNDGKPIPTAGWVYEVQFDDDGLAAIVIAPKDWA